MIKSITKEILIIILLILAILLILCILFYDYRPSTKKIPVPVAEYILPDTVQEELNETIKALETQNIVKTYYIDASDLKGYERIKAYDKGKANPFEGIKSSSVSANTSGGNSTGETSQTGTQGQILPPTAK